MTKILHIDLIYTNQQVFSDVMYIKTKSFIQWPEREILDLTMPTSFRKF